MKSSLYSTIFQKILTEDNIAGDGGVFGTFLPTGDDIVSRDTYAPGDSRNFFNFGHVQRRPMNQSAKKKKKSTKKRKKHS